MPVVAIGRAWTSFARHIMVPGSRRSHPRLFEAVRGVALSLAQATSASAKSPSTQAGGRMRERSAIDGPRERGAIREACIREWAGGRRGRTKSHIREKQVREGACAQKALRIGNGCYRARIREAAGTGDVDAGRGCSALHSNPRVAERARGQPIASRKTRREKCARRCLEYRVRVGRGVVEPPDSPPRANGAGAGRVPHCVPRDSRFTAETPPRSPRPP